MKLTCRTAIQVMFIYYNLCLFFFFFHLMATVNWLTILPLFGCAHKNLNILRRDKVKFIYNANKNSVI